MKEKRKYKKNRVHIYTSVKGRRNLLRSMNNVINKNNEKKMNHISFNNRMFFNGEFYISNDEKYYLNFSDIEKLQDEKCVVIFKKTYNELLAELNSDNYVVREKAKESIAELSKYVDLIFQREKAIIYYKPITDSYLRNYNMIINEINNIYMYNREIKQKEILKSIVKESILNPIDKLENQYCTFFKEGYKEDYINEIKKAIYTYKEENFKSTEQASIFANKIYTQLKNRIQFKNLNFYHYNTDEKNQSNKLRPTFITSLDKLKYKINYIKQMKWIFNEFFMDNIRHYLPKLIESENGEVIDINEYKRFSKKEQHDSVGSLNYEDYSESDRSYENDEYIAPYDYETYSDDSLRDEVRSGANSFKKQWGDKYLYFSRIIQKQNDENPYYNIRNYSLEIVSYYNQLLESNVFTETGNINQYSNYISQNRKNIRDFLLKNTDVKNSNERIKYINKEVNRILKIKKEEWKILHNIFSNDKDFFDKVEKLSTFNPLNLYFNSRKSLLDTIPF